jgi:hypothetical protein
MNDSARFAAHEIAGTSNRTDSNRPPDPSTVLTISAAAFILVEPEIEE